MSKQIPKLIPLLHFSQMESLYPRRSRRIAGLEPEHYTPQKQPESTCVSVLVITAGILFCSAVVPIFFKTFE